MEQKKRNFFFSILLFVATATVGCKGLISDYVNIGDTTVLSIETQINGAIASSSKMVSATSLSPEVDGQTTLYVVVRDLEGNYVKTTEGDWWIDDSSIATPDWKSNGGKSCKLTGMGIGTTKLNVTVDGRTASATINVSKRPKLVLGHPNEKTVINHEVNYSGAYGFDVKDNYMVVQDADNRRTLIWDSLPTSLNDLPSASVSTRGKYSLFAWADTDATKNVNHKAIDWAESATTDGTRLFVTDSGNNRILIWNTIPTTHGVLPDVVLGQPDFTSSASNNGGISASSLSYPTSVFSDGTRLAVGDHANHRVLIWNTIPTTNNQPADLVIGQSNFTSLSANGGVGISDSVLNGVWGLTISGSKLFVNDYYNNRVLIWNTFPTVSGQSADVVLGQPNMTSSGCNNPTRGADTLCGVGKMSVIGGRLFVPDQSNHRVLVWNTIPTANATPADYVIGQPDFVSGSVHAGGTRSDRSLNYPYKVAGRSSPDRVYILDYSNARIVGMNSFPTANYQPFDFVLGQKDFTTRNWAPLLPGGNSEKTLSYPNHAQATGDRLVVSDSGNNRVLVWNQMPTDHKAPADLVLGQSDFASADENAGGTISASSMDNPTSSCIDGSRLAVADYDNNRILIWNSIPTSSNTPADFALGQDDMISGASNSGGRSAQSLRNPISVFCGSGKLIAADFRNNRVLIWNTFPTAQKQAADVVVGQTNFTNGGQAITANRMSYPTAVYSDGTNLIVAQYYGNRVMIWNTLPTTNGESADVVLGQPDMVSNTANNGGVSAQSVSQPHGIAMKDGALYVADHGNSRILKWNSLPTVNQQAADKVFGQPNMTSGESNQGLATLGFDTFLTPQSISFASDGTAVITDMGNHRVILDSKSFK